MTSSRKHIWFRKPRSREAELWSIDQAPIIFCWLTRLEWTRRTGSCSMPHDERDIMWIGLDETVTSEAELRERLEIIHSSLYDESTLVCWINLVCLLRNAQSALTPNYDLWTYYQNWWEKNLVVTGRGESAINIIRYVSTSTSNFVPDSYLFLPRFSQSRSSECSTRTRMYPTIETGSQLFTGHRCHTQWRAIRHLSFQWPTKSCRLFSEDNISGASFASLSQHSTLEDQRGGSS